MPRVDIPKVGLVEFPDSMSSQDINAAAKRLYEGKGGSSFDKIPVREKAKARQTLMQSGPARQQFEQAQASATQDIVESKRKALETTVQMLPFALAAPFTGGASLEVGMLVMGGAGLASAAGHEILARQSGEKKSFDALTTSLGIGLFSGMLTEAGAQGIGYMGKTLLPKMVQRAAAGAAKGAEMLETAFTTTRQAIW